MTYTKEIIANQISESITKLQSKDTSIDDVQDFIKACINLCSDTKKVALQSLKESCVKIDEYIKVVNDKRNEIVKSSKALKKLIIKAEKNKNEEIKDLIEKAKEGQALCKKYKKDAKEILVELKRQKRKIYRPITTEKVNSFFNKSIWCIFACMVVLLSTLSNKAADIVVSCVSLVYVASYLGFKIFYIKTVLINKEKDLPYKILTWASKTVNYLFIIWLFLIFIAFKLCSKISDFYAIALLIIIGLKTAILIYEFFCDTKIYGNIGENILLLFISIILAVATITPVIQNSIVNEISKALLIVVSLYLTAFLVKNMLINKPNVSDVIDISCFILLLVLTIGLSILCLYNYFWDTNSTTGQPLFTAITGVYAAIIGGALTLAGVAWTIRKGDEQRKNDREQLEKDRKEEERKKHIPYMNPILSTYLTSVVSNPNVKNLEVSDAVLLKIENVKDGDTNFLFYYSFNDLYLKNISNNCLIVLAIVLNNRKIFLNGDQILESKDIVKINLSEYTFPTANDKLDAKLLVMDAVREYYYINLYFEEAMPQDEKYVDLSENGQTMHLQHYKCELKQTSLPKNDEVVLKYMIGEQTNG